MPFSVSCTKPSPTPHVSLDSKLLRLLRHSHTPASELAQQLEISPLQVHSAIEELRALGFIIPLHPTLGFRLENVPDRLLADDLLSRMKIPWLPEITVFAKTNSTNDLALQRGLHGAPGPIAFFAETQSAGRGRFGRHWHSPEGSGLWFSLLLRPPLPFSQWPRLTTAAAVAIARAITEVCGLKAGIKWPNDIWIDGKKVAGLLVETAHTAPQQPFAVLGIGINANQPDFPEALAPSATSLRLAKGAPIDRAELAACLLDWIGRLLPRLEADFEGILEDATKRSTVLGRTLRLLSGGEPVEGFAEALDAEGHLLLRLHDGSLRCFSAGEVTLRAP
jgi:BirA family biotin operon repressor/biotin-[acetyl-CoA-carboxylase] ligase